MSEYIYSAFISYKHDPDEALAGAIQEQIEHFYVPKAFRESALTDGKHLKRVFRDSTEFAGSFNLEESIKDALSKSAFLIVIISEDTKQSVWVQQEIEYFLKDHDRDHILTVLSSGDNPEAYYPEELTQILLEDGSEEKIEPLSVDYRDYQPKQRLRSKGNKKVYASEFPRIAAPLLGVSYDDLVKRQERYRKQRMFILVNTALAVVSIALVYSVWSEIRVNRNYREAMKRQSEILLNNSLEALEENDRTGAIRYALRALPTKEGEKDMPVTPRAQYALSRAVGAYVIPNDPAKETPIFRIELNNGIQKYETDPSGRYVMCVDNDQWLRMDDLEKGQVLYNGSLHEYGRFGGMYVCGGEFYIMTLTSDGWNLHHVAKDGTIHQIEKLKEYLHESLAYFGFNVLAGMDRIFFVFQMESPDGKPNLKVVAYSSKDDDVSLYESAIPVDSGTMFDHFRYDPESDAITFTYYKQNDTFQVIRSGVGIYIPEKNSIKIYDANPTEIDEYMIDGSRIIYLSGFPNEHFGDTGTYYMEYAMQVGCIRTDGKKGWTAEDIRYGEAREVPILKSAMIGNTACILIGTSDAVSIHEADTGQLLRRCEFHSDVKDIWFQDTIGAILERGELARIDLYDPVYTISEAFSINIDNARRIENSFLGNPLTFIIDDRSELVIYAAGWGDDSFIPLGETKVPFVIGSATHGTLAAMILQGQDPDSYEICLIDTEQMTELWRKPLPNDAIPSVYSGLMFDFTGDGSQICLFSYGYPNQEMYEYAFSVEDGSEERIPITVTDELTDTQIICITITGYPAYLIYNPENTGYGYKIFRLEDGVFCEHDLILPDSDYETMSTYDSSEDGRYQLLTAKRGGERNVLLYDLEMDSCSVLEELSHRKAGEVAYFRVFYSEEKVIICELDTKLCRVYDLSTGRLVMELEIPESTVGSADIRGNSLYLFGFDGYLREYDIKKKKMLKSVRLTTQINVLDREEWYYDGESILLSLSKDGYSQTIYVLDKNELELTDEIASFVDYNPETRTFLVNDNKIAFGGYKKHTLEELVEMGYEQLGND